MAEATNKATQEQKPVKIGERPVGIAGIIPITAYLIIFSGFRNVSMEIRHFFK
jgi:hypothetical protein